MEINLNTSLHAVAKAAESQSKPRPTPVAQDGTDFAAAAAVNAALDRTAEVRADAVARSRGLVADVNYPPEETLNKIAHLLAIRINPESN